MSIFFDTETASQFAIPTVWDVFSEPMVLLSPARAFAADPLGAPRFLAVTAIFTAFLMILYLLLWNVAHIALRVDRVTLLQGWNAHFSRSLDVTRILGWAFQGAWSSAQHLATRTSSTTDNSQSSLGAWRPVAGLRYGSTGPAQVTARGDDRRHGLDRMEP